MSAVVWKIRLGAGVNEVLMPADAEILCAREQRHEVCVWFRCDPDRVGVPRTLYVVGTGHPAPARARYVGSAMLMGGDSVWHVFEGGRS